MTERIACWVIGGVLSLLIHFGVFQLVYVLQKPPVSEAVAPIEVVFKDSSRAVPESAPPESPLGLDDVYEELEASGKFPEFRINFSSIGDYLSYLGRAGGELYVYDSSNKKVLGFITKDLDVLWGRQPDLDVMSPRLRYLEDPRFSPLLSTARGKYGGETLVIALIPKEVEKKWMQETAKEIARDGITIKEVTKIRGSLGSDSILPNVEAVVLTDGSIVRVNKK